MEQPFDLICATEEAIQALEALELPDQPQPFLQQEVQRLEDKLDFLNTLAPAFKEPADLSKSKMSQ